MTTIVGIVLALVGLFSLLILLLAARDERPDIFKGAAIFLAADLLAIFGFMAVTSA